MTTVYDQAIDGLLEQYRAQRAKASELQRRIREITATVTASRRAVTVTVGGQGEVHAIEFPTGAYRRMPPTELAELVKSTLEQARLRARADVLDLVTADVSPGMARLMRGEADVADVLPAEPFMPDVVRDYVQSGRPPGAPGPIELPGPGTLLKGDPDGR